MADLTEIESSQAVKLTGGDESRFVDVALDGGFNKLRILGTFVAGVSLGRDPFPDNFLKIITAGAIGDTVKLEVDGINDPTGSEREVAAVDATYTLIADDVDDEIQLRDNLITFFNADSDFKASLIAKAVKDRATFQIQSLFLSLPGEFYERSGANSVKLTFTGTTTGTLGFDNLLSRDKDSGLTPDPDNPHRLGRPGFSGDVVIKTRDLDKLFFADAENGGSSELTVDGTTPVVFTISANAAGADDILIDQLKLHGTDVNIKTTSSAFMGINSAITNGLKIEIFTNSTSFTLPLLKTTRDILARFSTSASDQIVTKASGGDFLYSVFDLIKKNVQLRLEAGTTDKIEVTVQDDLTSIDTLIFTAEGTEEESI